MSRERRTDGFFFLKKKKKNEVGRGTEGTWLAEKEQNGMEQALVMARARAPGEEVLFPASFPRDRAERPQT